MQITLTDEQAQAVSDALKLRRNQLVSTAAQCRDHDTTARLCREADTLAVVIDQLKEGR